MPPLLTADENAFPNPKPRALLVAYKAFADAAGKGSLFVITIVAARRLTPRAFGIFSLGSTVGWMAAVASDFGIQMHLARTLARTTSGAREALQAWLRVRCWTAAAALAVVAAGLAVARSSTELAAPILLLAFVYATSGLVELVYYYFRGLARTDLESSLTIWQRSGTLVCGLAALAWRPTVGTLAIAMLVPAVLTLVVSLRIASGIARAAVGGPSMEVVRAGFLRDVAPIGAGILLSALYFRVDVLLVQWWAGTEQVAQYNAVFRLVEALRLFPAAVLAVALPALCRARDWRPLVRVAGGVTAFGGAIALVLWPLAGQLVTTLYGVAYAAAAPAFAVLLFSFPLLSLNYALTHQLIAWNGQRAYAGICAFALAANVALNAQWIPAWSIVGAAWATLGTELVVAIGCAIALAGHRARLGTMDAARAEPVNAPELAGAAIEDGALT
jgi:O-antigen/teichoic acid export membrane protein